MAKDGNFPIQKIILGTLIVAGGLSLAAVAPNVLGAIMKLNPSYAKRKDVQRRIQETLWRMERNGLVSLPKRGSMGRVTLLPKGQELIRKIQARTYTVSKPLIWDGKWRIVMFDIPEQKRNARIQLRRLLESAGLVRLHDSVWVHPYPCDELITLIKAHLKNTRGELYYFVAEMMASDRFLRDMFNLI